MGCRVPVSPRGCSAGHNDLISRPRDQNRDVASGGGSTALSCSSYSSFRPTSLHAHAQGM
eukprot:2257525-Pyramimonas_sp.AAC.1